MIKIVILGNGNVATHLAKTFLKVKDVKLIQVYTRRKKPKFFIKNKIDITHNLTNLKDASIYIIAISDDWIIKFSEKLHLKNKLVVHTSGSVGMQELNCKGRKGVFYPLQTISKNAKINFKNIPICIEAENENDYLFLEKLANSISKNVNRINSIQRENLHLAAVFVNNFTNHLYKIGNDICDKNKVDFNLLKPLITETSKKIQNISPKNAQTGPAKRKDDKTITKHLELLTKDQKEIYILLSNSIKNCST